MRPDNDRGGTEKPFGKRSASCADCRVDETNAIETMRAVAMGDRDPKEWWCDQHIEVFEEETRDWAEGTENGVFD
ncbi:hypothetical protein OB905_13220 [Halobacteria archaeon AArc-dxtr1]|nr:hypothetical protein [Halobacteria archaeon AArc-dxtr1]